MDDDELYDMDDAALEEAFKAAKAELAAEQETDTSIESEEPPVEDAAEDSETTTEGEDGTAAEGSEEDDAGTETDEADEGGTESDEAGEETDEPESTDPVKPAEPVVHKFKANGKEFEVTDEEMREQFPRVFAQAANYTQKLQAIKPWRRTIDALEQASMSHADVNLMIDILKGDKNAIAEVLKRTGVDPLDLNTEKTDELYVPNNYGRDESALSLKDVLDTIKVDKEFSVTEQVISREWDEKSWSVLRESPEKIQLLHNDVKSGLYEKLAPIAEKLKIFSGGTLSDLEYYVEAGREYFSRLNKNQTLQREEKAVAAQEAAKAAKEKERLAKVRSAENKRTADRSAAEQRRAAAPSAPSRAKPGAGVDYLNSSDEDFEEWYKKLEERG